MIALRHERSARLLAFCIPRLMRDTAYPADSGCGRYFIGAAPIVIPTVVRIDGFSLIQANPAPGTEWIFFLRFANWGDLTR
ncbi:hypothetical protein PERCYII29_3086 [Pseudomonas aeruginosa]|nr:hypothetical protein PERCYII29_3086 [Pseudomonas aeruginosa]